MARLVLLFLLLLITVVQAFQVATTRSLLFGGHAVLFAKRGGKRKSPLAEVVADGPAVRIASQPAARNKTIGKKTRRSTTAADAAVVSPALAEWASSGTVDDEITTETSTTKQLSSSSSVDDVGATFMPFEDEEEEEENPQASSRRVKQSKRQQEEKDRDETLDGILAKLEDALGETSNLDDILTGIQSLVSLGESTNNNIRQLTASAKTYNYRLAWVGSDEALAYIGTGLHKVPLARMEEVFMNLQARNRVEIFEVIRIIGPFPNVRNTLQGDSSISKSNSNQLQIVYDSMIDGTGKELLAGTNDNVRRVSLQIAFCDAKAIVAVASPNDKDDDGQSRRDPLHNNGANVLLFVQEPDLDTRLEKLRVN